MNASSDARPEVDVQMCRPKLGLFRAVKNAMLDDKASTKIAGGAFAPALSQQSLAACCIHRRIQLSPGEMLCIVFHQLRLPGSDLVQYAGGLIFR